MNFAIFNYQSPIGVEDKLSFKYQFSNLCIRFFGILKIDCKIENWILKIKRQGAFYALGV